MEFLGRRAAGEEVRERPADAGNLIRRLVDKLDPEMPDSRREPFRQMQARFLRFGAKDGVAAADVGHHRMRAAVGNPAARPGVFARAAAIAIAGAGGKEAAEDAVFGVEHGQVLVGDGFQVLRTDAFG